MNRNALLLFSITMGIIGLIRLYETVDRYAATGTVPWIKLLSAVAFLALAFVQVRAYRRR